MKDCGWDVVEFLGGIFMVVSLLVYEGKSVKGDKEIFGSDNIWDVIFKVIGLFISSCIWIGIFNYCWFMFVFSEEDFIVVCKVL